VATSVRLMVTFLELSADGVRGGTRGSGGGGGEGVGALVRSNFKRSYLRNG